MAEKKRDREINMVVTFLCMLSDVKKQAANPDLAPISHHNLESSFTAGQRFAFLSPVSPSLSSSYHGHIYEHLSMACSHQICVCKQNSPLPESSVTAH